MSRFFLELVIILSLYWGGHGLIISRSSFLGALHFHMDVFIFELSLCFGSSSFFVCVSAQPKLDTD